MVPLKMPSLKKSDSYQLTQKMTDPQNDRLALEGRSSHATFPLHIWNRCGLVEDGITSTNNAIIGEVSGSTVIVPVLSLS